MKKFLFLAKRVRSSSGSIFRGGEDEDVDEDEDEDEMIRESNVKAIDN